MTQHAHSDRLLLPLSSFAGALRAHTDVDPNKCIQLMTKLLYLLGKGENFSSKESTESIFFPMTKLFQSKDEKLRRLMCDSSTIT